MLLEICASSFNCAQAALKGGADRIELCDDLSIGGITPNSSLISKVINELDIETHVLIRARGGNFCYSDEEIERMLGDILEAKNAGAKGVVFGALTSDNNLDISAITKMSKAAQGMDYSFHKAFDELHNPETAFKELINLGFTRVLTSGRKATALEGLPHLIQWQKNYGSEIEIMPGGRIRPNNITRFVGHDFRSVHSAAIPSAATETDPQVVAIIKQSIAD
ncbi:MAG: copper homeostasis protein CutC [Gilvibacter sp.]